MNITRAKRKAAEGIRYEPYEKCPFCKGRGCFGCKERRTRDEKAAQQEADAKAYLDKHLLFSARFDNPDEMATFKSVFAAERLGEFYDASDLTDEDTLRHIGQGDAREGERLLRCAIEFYGPCEDFEKMRARMLEKCKQDMAAERGTQRIRAALQNKAANQFP